VPGARAEVAAAGGGNDDTDDVGVGTELLAKVGQFIGRFVVDCVSESRAIDQYNGNHVGIMAKIWPFVIEQADAIIVVNAM